jgi:hypothetical protein
MPLELRQPLMKTNPLDLKHGLHPEEAAAALGSVQLFRELVAAHWIKPVVKRHKLTLYDREDLARCWARLCQGEHPWDDPGDRENQKVETPVAAGIS